MFLNANIPPISCYVRKEYLRNLEDGHGEFVECSVFAMKSWTGRALLFWCMTDKGAIYDKIPISAFTTNKDAPHQSHHILQLWNSFSYQPSVTEFQFLKGKKCQTTLRDGSKHLADYHFTIDWAGSNAELLEPGYAEIPPEHKCAHIIELENGNFAAQPNNRVRWADPAFVMEPFESPVDYKLNEQEYLCENVPKWVTEDTDAWAYDINEFVYKEKKND